MAGDTRTGTSQTFEERAGEALAAAQFLRGKPGIDPEWVGLLGGSQGGWVAPLATTLNEVAFVIAVSAPGITPAEQEVYRVEHELRADGFSHDQIERALDLTRGCQAALRAGRPLEEIVEVARAVEDEPWYGYLYLPDSTPTGWRARATWPRRPTCSSGAGR